MTDATSRQALTVDSETEDRVGRILRNFVAGAFVESGRTWDKIGPVGNAVIARVYEVDAGLVDRAVSAARAEETPSTARRRTRRCRSLTVGQMPRSLRGERVGFALLEGRGLNRGRSVPRRSGTRGA